MKLNPSLPLIFRAACLLALAVFPACSKKAHPLSEQMVHSQISRCGDATYLDYTDGRLKWSYAPGMELRAYLDVFETYGDTAVYNFVHKWYDSIVADDGTIQGYTPDRYSSDKISPAKSLFYFYDETRDEKYRKAIELVKSQIDGQPRTPSGAFWFKEVYPNQIWLDGVYMVYPFYVEYAARFLSGEAQTAAFDDIVHGIVITRDKCLDPETGLLRHACDESGKMFWCDPSTKGQSFHCWGRALGYYCLGILEVLDWLPEHYKSRQSLVDILRGICDILPKWADAESGVWYQVLDQPGREGNYLEATASAMFVYTYLKGIRKGYLDTDLLPYAKNLYQDFVDEFITTDGPGLISIEKCCSVCGLGGSSNRMGDFAYYLSEPVRPNDAKGVAPFIWASLEMERME
jgi:unsaturated rhamnogalacturonyl hydrolase